MDAVRAGVSACGSTNTSRAGHLPPLPCIGETSDSVLSGSSPPRSKASADAACYAADAKTKPVVEASAGKNDSKMLATLRQLPGTLLRRWVAYPPPLRLAVLMHPQRPRLPRDRRRRGRFLIRHAETGSFVLEMELFREEVQVRLPVRANFIKPSTTQDNIILERTRHPSLLDRRGAVIDWRTPKVENEVYDNNWRNDTVSSRISSGSNHGAMKPSATLQDIILHTPRDPSLLDMRGSSSACLLSKSALGPLGILKDKAALDLSASAHQTSGGTIDEWSLHEEKGQARFKPFAIPQTIRPQAARVPNPLDMRAEGSSQAPPSSTHSAGNKEAYTSPLGAGGGYGDPHPPPFYKCEVCCKKTAFYRLKCCRVVVCEGCGCSCDPADAAEDEKPQCWRRRGKVLLTGKEKLPEVKLEGSDLFLWQRYKFPERRMLCMAKRTGNNLKYYFAPVHKLMDPEVKVIRATVYDFRQHGRGVKSLSVRDELLMRKQLC
ncbi:hypothetical protein HU200_066056 [Digitaria exilis]|uniref:Uncharacterized protein n=1 Tax=Digitaria exilis TaxID=1010633 RepID=A0A835A2T5_9POAL|nr:hypothetical protein HU200_066056 [Digitaria exilis]